MNCFLFAIILHHFSTSINCLIHFFPFGLSNYSILLYQNELDIIFDINLLSIFLQLLLIFLLYLFIIYTIISRPRKILSIYQICKKIFFIVHLRFYKKLLIGILFVLLTERLSNTPIQFSKWFAAKVETTIGKLKDK